METIIEFDGVPYTFAILDGTGKLKYETETTPSTDTEPQVITVPNAWIITRSNGVPLFAVRPNDDDKPFRIITANKLYGEKVQWFEPLANYYRELIWVNPESSVDGTESYKAYKHHTWQSIIDFAIVDRPSFLFAPGMPGDWKLQKKGGDEFLLSLVEGEPYWTDGLGQIPFAVDTFRMYWEQTNDIDLSIKKTGITGLNFADGISRDKEENVYDNFIIMRASLWASKNFLRVISPQRGGLRGGGAVPEVKTLFKPISVDYLQTPITAEHLARYKTWAL